MIIDLASRLRGDVQSPHCDCERCVLFREAADRIERLERKVVVQQTAIEHWKQKAAHKVPEGYALVPLICPDHVAVVGRDVFCDWASSSLFTLAEKAYEAMVKASSDVPSHDGMTPEQYWAACRAEGAIKRNDDAEKD
jgi:hypothetical protein